MVEYSLLQQIKRVLTEIDLSDPCVGATTTESQLRKGAKKDRGSYFLSSSRCVRPPDHPPLQRTAKRKILTPAKPLRNLSYAAEELVSLQFAIGRLPSRVKIGDCADPEGGGLECNNNSSPRTQKHKFWYLCVTWVAPSSTKFQVPTTSRRRRADSELASHCQESALPSMPQPG